MPTFRATGVFTATLGTSVPVGIPPSVQDGDMLIVAIATQSDAATLTAPGAWTAFTDSPVTDAPTGDSRLYCWWRVASSEPVSYTFTLSTPTACSGGLVAYQSAGAIDQQEMVGTSTAATVMRTPVVTPGATGTLVVCIFAVDAASAGGEFTETGALTKRVDISDSSAFTRIAIADADAADLALLYPDSIIYPDDVVYPDGEEIDLRGSATFPSSLPSMTAIASILEGTPAAPTTRRRRMLTGVGV